MGVALQKGSNQGRKNGSEIDRRVLSFVPEQVEWVAEKSGIQPEFGEETQLVR